MIKWLREILNRVLAMKADYDKLKTERAEAGILIKEIMDALGIKTD